MVSPEVVFTQVTRKDWEGWAYIHVTIRKEGHDIEEQSGIYGGRNWGGEEGENDVIVF